MTPAIDLNREAGTQTYRNDWVINYGYDESDSMADALSRVASIIDSDEDDTHLDDYGMQLTAPLLCLKLVPIQIYRIAKGLHR